MGQTSCVGTYLNTQFGDVSSLQNISSTSSGGSEITGYQNVAIGAHTLPSLTTGYTNLALGSYSMTALTTGYNNTGLVVEHFIK